MKYFLIGLILIILALLVLIYCIYKINKKQQSQLDKLNNIDLNLNSSFWHKISRPIVELYEKNNFILYLFSSVILYILASFEFPEIHLINKYVIPQSAINNILISAATVVLSSGVFSSITKSKHFLTIFSNEIKKIVYTEQFLSKQNNIDEIWNIVTKSVCDENFHKISDKLFNKIKQNYLPINHNFYYENYSLELHLKHDEVDGIDYVIIKEITKVDLICDEKKQIDYSSSSNIEYLPNEEDNTSFKLEEFLVNGADYKGEIQLTNNKTDGLLSAKLDCKLQGEYLYSIQKTEEKKYSLKLNANRVHSAVKIFHNFKLTVYYPDNIIVRFTKLGGDDNWLEPKYEELGNKMKYLKTEYNGVFFQNQGYMINFLIDK